MAKNKKQNGSKKPQKVKDMDEFRKLNTKEGKGHPHYVYSSDGKNYQSIGLTHAKHTKGQKNIPLKKNPNPQDKEQAYVRPKLTKEKAKAYGKRLDGLGLSQEDKSMVWNLIERLKGKKKSK